MSNAKVKAVLIPCGGSPRVIEVEDSLAAKQKAVGGLIEAFSPLWGEEPLLWVNEEGIYSCPPNRAVFATKEMSERGYLSQISASRGVVQEGELYTVLFGDILAIAYGRDEEGGEFARDMTDEEIAKVCRTFEDPDSGFKACLAIKSGMVG